MEKVFINDMIFESDGDYVIGGFNTDQLDSFEFADFYEALLSRLSRLIDQYLNEATLVNAKLGYENPMEQAHEDIFQIVFDNLKLESPYKDKQSIINTILSNDKMQSWVINLKENVKNYPESYNIENGGNGIVNFATKIDVHTETYRLAKQFTDETTFEQLIEQISTIEL
jgi:hypothetical protein